MTWENFVKQYEKKEVVVFVNAQSSGYMYENYFIPENKRTKQVLIRTLFFVFLISGIVMLFIKVLLALLLIAVGLYCSKLAMKIAAKDVFDCVLNSSSSFEFAVDNRIITIYELEDFLDKAVNEGLLSKTFTLVLSPNLPFEEKYYKVRHYLAKNKNVIILY